MTSLLKRFISVFFRQFVGRHYMLISALSVLVSALAVWVIATQWNINSDFKALLPTSSEAYQAMEEVGNRVGSGSALFVVIDSPDGQANKRFAKDYADKLRELDQVALAHYKNDKTFFEEHKLLYLQPDDLRTLHDRIKKKIRDKKKKSNPLFVDLGGSSEDEGLKTDDIEQKYDDQAHQEYKEYLVSDDGYSMTIVVRFVESSTNLEATNRLLDQVDAVGHSLDPSSYHPEMKLEYGGGLVNRQAEYSSILSDVRTSAIFTIVGLFLVIGLYFRRLRALTFVLTPLIMGVIWTLAIGFLLFGELTTVTVFIFAILLGLAIDFSIHLLSGYNHLRAEGMKPVDALVGCYSTTGKATVIGAFTTFVTFVVLSFAQFRGLSQFGQVASIGVICTLLAMLVVLPALILTVQHVLTHEPSAPGSTFLGIAPGGLFKEARVRRFAPLFLLAAAGLAALAMTQLPKVAFEENFRNIGEIEWPWAEEEKERSPAEVAEADAAHQARVVVKHAIEARGEMDPETFEPPREQNSTGAKWTSAVGSAQSSTPTVLLFDDPENARKVFRLMDERLENGELDTVRSLGSIHAFVPGTREEQEERIVEIRRIDELLADEDLSVLGKKDRERVDELSESLEAEPVDVYDLPPWSKRLFRESGDGAHAPAEGEEIAFEYIIYVNSAVNAMNGADARRYLAQLQDVREASGVDFRIGSQAYIYVAMLDELKTDGVRMMGIALLVVFLILAFVFRNPFRGLVALTPLLLGALWMFGLAGWLGIRLDFFNVIILPVIIGVGVDDGVHFYHHYRDLGPGSVGAVIRKVGAAIAMTSVTSMIGFGGLAVTTHDGLQSIGYLAIAGIASTLVATLLVLPAILWMGEKYDIQWLVGGE